jgi:hypothetical protein
MCGLGACGWTDILHTTSTLGQGMRDSFPVGMARRQPVFAPRFRGSDGAFASYAERSSAICLYWIGALLFGVAQ